MPDSPIHAHESVGHLCGRWAAMALEPRLKPYARFDAAGLVAMIGGCRIVGMTKNTATLLRASAAAIVSPGSEASGSDPPVGVPG